MKINRPTIILALTGTFLLASAGSAADDNASEFLRYGLPIGDQADNLSTRKFQQYEIALKEFQHVDDCVEVPEGEPRYELSLMRWKQLNNLEKVNVCIFLLAAELNNHRQMLNWFNSNGFKAILIERGSSVLRFYNRDGDGFLVSASAPIRAPIRVGFLDRLLAHGVSIGVTFASDGEPLNVNTTINRI